MIQAGRFVCQDNRPAILFLSSIDIIKNMPTNNKKKKILYVITKSNWGGAQNYVHSLATNLSENYETVVAHGGDGLMCKKLDQSKIKRIRIKTLDRDVKIWNELKVLKKLIGIFKEEGPDIVHLNSSKIGGLGALAGRIAGIEKIIFTAHGFAFNEDRPYWQRTAIKFFSYMTILLSHKTIVIAKREFEQVKNWPLVSKKIVLIYNGINKIDFFDKDEAQEKILEKLKIKDSNLKDLIWVGTISELTKNKGLGYAIKGIKNLQESLHRNWNGIFVIIGSGEDRGYLENLIKQEGLENNVYLTGFIDDAKKYLKAFDIFLMSSVKEGFPYALLEAGLAGNAIICTDVGGTSEIVDNLESGILIRPKNKKEIMNALRLYMEDEDKIVEYGDRIKQKVLKEFSVEKMVEETLRIY